MRIKTDRFDEELELLVQSAILDLQSVGVVILDIEDELIQTAIILYSKLHFGSPDNYDQLKVAYDELKAQLKTSARYTNFEA